MNREQVMLLSDDELRLKAAELAGWKGGERLCAEDPSSIITCLEGEEDISDCTHLDGGGCWKDCARKFSPPPPDYPSDIAAAMELFALIPIPCGIERGYEKKHGVGPVGFYVGFGILPPEHDEDDVWAETVWNELASRAITRAFLLAMTQEEKQNG